MSVLFSFWQPHTTRNMEICATGEIRYKNFISIELPSLNFPDNSTLLLNMFSMHTCCTSLNFAELNLKDSDKASYP